jgi:hypothetical protein
LQKFLEIERMSGNNQSRNQTTNEYQFELGTIATFFWGSHSLRALILRSGWQQKPEMLPAVEAIERSLQALA